MKYAILILSLMFFVIGCKEEQAAGETQDPADTNETETPNTQEVDADIQQTNVVTPEFWENFDTDVQVVFYYSKIESSPEKVHAFKEKLLNGSEKYSYDFHEYHTDENMGMVQVDDNVFFNLTEYLWNNNEGFVLLKQGALLHIPASNLGETTFNDEVVPFFQ